MPDRPRPTNGPEVRRESALAKVERDATACRRCDLWKHATQTVFGAGPSDAAIVLIGEQPGDAEDREGMPFVGPAGRLLRDALAEAGIDAEAVYLTNAVKHFKWRASGKRRIHERPNRDQILACRMWLDAEIAILKPRVLVALGATAASVILPTAKVMRDRGKVFSSPVAKIVTVTVHPSSILRAPDPQSRAAARRRFIQDLRKIARMAHSPMKHDER
jgi:uracil-DNA glycosylase family protein